LLCCIAFIDRIDGIFGGINGIWIMGFGCLGVGGGGDLAGGVVAEEVGAAVGSGAGEPLVALVVGAGFAFQDFATGIGVGDFGQAANFIVVAGGGDPVGVGEGIGIPFRLVRDLGYWFFFAK